jgi:preprotein translocase subunit SecD
MKGRGLLALSVVFVVLVGLVFYLTKVNPIFGYLREGLDLKGGVDVVLQATRPATPTDMKKVETIIQYRANNLGVSEPVIQLQNSNEVSVQLAGVKNQEEAIRLIGQTAQLRFVGPDGKTILTGKDLVSAQAALGQGNVPEVLLSFNAEGARLFAAATTKDVGQVISVYLDQNVIQRATVQEPITGGQAQISPFPSLKAAQQVATLLNSGALPVPMRIIEVRTVSATLGQDSIRASEAAGVVAMALIVLLMLILYRVAGLLADMALAVYLLLLVGFLIWIQAVITLPGVAGMILSAGIAVDANVIIFARIRDELRAGRTVGAAIDHGFKNAFRAILDSNVSTIIASIVLYYMGSGEVRGFALTLGAGVAMSFISAVVVTRWLLRLAEASPLTKNLDLFVGFRRSEHASV